MIYLLQFIPWILFAIVVLYLADLYLANHPPFVPVSGISTTDGYTIIGRRERIVLSMVNLLDKEVLDFGCGSGIQTKVFLKYIPKKLVGVDIRTDELGKYAKDTSILFDTKVVGMFDIVLSFDVMEHVENEDVVLQTIYSHCRSNAQGVFIVPNRWWIFETHGGPYIPHLNRIPFFSWMPTKIHDDWSYARIYSKRSIRKVLERNGFIVDYMEYVTAPMDTAPTFMQSFLRSTLFFKDITSIPFLAVAIAVKFRKDI